jgi:predicted nucleotidyltransferase
MNTKQGLSEQTVSRITRVFEQFPAVEKAVLFGSRAKGVHKRGSDIDLALVGVGLNWRVLGKIEDALDDLLLPYKFSLIIYNDKTDAAVAAHIQRVGCLFYEREPVLPGRTAVNEAKTP